MELKFEKDEFEAVVKQSKSIRDICRKYNKPINGYYGKLFSKWIKIFGCDTSHFLMKSVFAKCQHCGNEYEIIRSHKKKRKFCSLKCANQKIRGCALPKNVENLYGTGKHRRICFRFHKKECVVCGETIAVTVHHYNEDHSDDRPENLVPLCANHHIYLHSTVGRSLVKDVVDRYVKTFMGY